MNGGVRLVSLPALISFFLEQLIGYFTEDFLPNREAKCLEKLVHPLLSILSLLTSPEIDPPLRGGSRFPKVSSLRGGR